MDDETLRPGEVIRARAHRHWFPFAASTALLLAAFPAAFLMPSDYPRPWRLTGMLLFLGLFLGAAALLERLTTRIVLTSQRLIIKEWWFGQKITDLDLASLEGVDDKPSILGVFLNYGDMIVRSRDRKDVRLKRIADPDAFRNAIAEQTRKVL